MKVLIATKNPGKFREISNFLKMPGLSLQSLKDFPAIADPVETGKNFQENSLIKARYFAEAFGVTTLADDGGLEIEVLNGEPGVHSRRWLDGQHEASDEDLIQYCLSKLQNEKNRRAKLTACLCLFLKSQVVSHDQYFFVQESIEGVIAEKPCRERWAGFPFRSLLWVENLKKFYNENEFTSEETRKYNHRYKAIQKIKTILKNVKP